MTSLTIGTARHPFRAALPARVLRRLPQFEPEVLARIAEVEAAGGAAEAGPAPRGRSLRISAQDVRDFLLAYIACFLAVSAWIG